MVLLLPLLLARVEMARLLMLLTLALQLEVTAQCIAELAKDGVGVVSAPGVATVTTELLETKAKKSVLVVANDAVKKQLQDGAKKMTDKPPEGLRANLHPAYWLPTCKLSFDAKLDFTTKPFEYKELLRGFSDTDYDISKE